MYMMKNIRTGYEWRTSLNDNLEKNTKDIIIDVMHSITAVGSDFEEYPDKYLTESDARCFLFNEFMRNHSFNRVSPTQDNSQSIPLHTEVRWYGNEGKLKYRSDIVIIETADLRTQDKIMKLPSKGFAFNKFNAIIEIKLRRSNGERDGNFIKKIEYDVEKLIEIEKEVADVGNLEYALFIFILDKKNKNGSMYNLINGKFFGIKKKYNPFRDLFICYFASP